MTSSVQLAQATLEHAAKPIRERPRIGRTIAVEQARLLVKQMCGVLLERAVGVAERGQRRNELVLRIDFENRLGRRSQPAGTGEEPFEGAVGPLYGARPGRRRCR